MSPDVLFVLVHLAGITVGWCAARLHTRRQVDIAERKAHLARHRAASRPGARRGFR